MRVRMNNWNMRGATHLCAYAVRIHSVADLGCTSAPRSADRTFDWTAAALSMRYGRMRMDEIVSHGISFS
ncbi:hypothetical protein AYM40_09190 [Paraburkholderia phytofirmans OLGA172]|uniref:Uncharacterized protein n=1 Tax=Paraburkholderia phytofirmans OLGA172 TaxID=1417228 RepID=A0A160FJJ5_9BURK|nr:hypothetical protein AYM40_09190 [Paraburkholderia phytofirmans OLGA172]